MLVSETEELDYGRAKGSHCWLRKNYHVLNLMQGIQVKGFEFTFCSNYNNYIIA